MEGETVVDWESLDDVRSWQPMIPTASVKRNRRQSKIAPKIQCAVEDYRSRLAWPVQVRDGKVTLPLTGGLAAVAAPFAALERLLVTDSELLEGPMILMPGATPRVWILAEAENLILTNEDLPPGVQFHSPPAWAVLPPSVLRTGTVRWLREPHAARRFLPAAAAVLALLA